MILDQVIKSIDNIVIKSFQDNETIENVISDLDLRKKNITRLFENETKNIPKHQIDRLEINNRALWAHHFINKSEHRLETLKWMINKREKFKIYSNLSFFKLIKFKEKLYEARKNRSIY